MSGCRSVHISASCLDTAPPTRHRLTFRLIIREDIFLINFPLMKIAFHVLPQFLLFHCLLILWKDPSYSSIACYKRSKLHGFASQNIIFSLRHARGLETNIPKFTVKFRNLVSVRRPCILRPVSIRLCIRNTNLKYLTISKVRRCRSLTEGFQVQTQDSSRGICAGRSGTNTGFTRLSVLTSLYQSLICHGH